MLQLSKILCIFVVLFERKQTTSRRAKCFDPSENLENSKYMGDKSESCFSCSSIYTAHSVKDRAHIYPCRCEPIPFLHIQVFQNLLTKDVKKAHTLCAYSSTD